MNFAYLLVVPCSSMALWGALVMGGWSFWLEPASLQVVENRIVLGDWPVGCDGLRVAVLSDLHVGSPFNGIEKLEQIVEATNGAAPDVVLLAGDYVIHGVVGGAFEPPESVARVLADLSPPAGVFAVLGNHDHWYDAPRIRRAFEDAELRVLEDESHPVELGSCRFWLAGIGDFTEAPHDVAAALEGVPGRGATIALTHNPDVFPEIPSRVALTIAGHTHGGQVALPILGRPIVPSRHGERFAIGHVEEGGRHLFVTPGLGTSILPVRFRVPPEISLLTLEARAAGDEALQSTREKSAEAS